MNHFAIAWGRALRMTAPPRRLRWLPRWWVSCLALASGVVLARPVELLVPYPAGGFTDVMARAVAQDLSRLWNEPVIVTNKPGANSVVAIRHAIEQGGADGRLILLGSFGYLTMQFQSRGAPFDPKALAPVVLLGSTASVLYVRGSIPAATVQEFVAWGRKAGGVSFGTSGVASSPHLDAEEFAARTGLGMTHVPFAGSSASIPALAGGHVDAVFDSAASRAMVRAGKIRALMVGDDTALPDWPELPTAREAGLPGFRSGTWFGLFVNARTPRALQRKLNEDVNKVLATVELRARLTQMDFAVKAGGQEAFEQFLVSEQKKLETLIRTRHINVD